ncbi:MAG TPA: hypothetical protein VKE40_26405 [Gemmataceae bacterium]|nr:hypothetical protein [Gemmataceae bacterium]
MKKLSTLVFAAALGAVGCMGTTGPKSYEADAPLAVETSAKADKPDRRTTEPEPTRVPAGTARVHADDIDDSNYQDSLRQLQSDVNQDRKALGKAGR